MRVSTRLALAVLLAVALGAPAHAAPSAPVFLHGADLSSLPEVEAAGGVFRDGGRTGDALDILHAHGMDVVRLRLWHSPARGVCGLAATERLARRVKQRGMPLLLDLHFSDTWADPAHQTKPAAWKDVHGRALEDSVFEYTRDVLATLRAAGATPDWVQLGNEIGQGLLWPDGKLDGSQKSWQQCAGLLRAAVRGVKKGAGRGANVRVLIHYEGGGDAKGATTFFARLQDERVPFDALALSYYPWWHGTLNALSETLRALATRFDRDLLVVETAYPWTLAWQDDTHNLVGEARQLQKGFPATVGGQRAFLAAVVTRVARTPGGHGRGVFYWEPAAITAPRRGSAWENCALFNAEGELMPSAAGLAGSTRDTLR